MGTNAHQQQSSASSTQMKTSLISKKAKREKRPKNIKGKGKKVTPTKQEELVRTLDECKAQHSKLLTKLHEEVHPQLKEIRVYLNTLDHERQPPKERKKRKKKGSKNAICHQTL